MWSLETLHQLNQEAAKKARARKPKPWVPLGEWQLAADVPLPIPYFGEYVPDGWEKVCEWFVDSSGLGLEGEPALTQEEFLKALRLFVPRHPDYGYAISEQGEFQCYVTAYKPVGSES